jgi:nitroimidazol reductase NimA-like FMN-containing flavoprotein (pyridoxamine 5'-phosphate oxidase superfamily)
MTDAMVELPEDECRRLLARARFGRIGIVVDGRAVVLPVNYVFDEGFVIFRSSEGTKLDAALGAQVVAFEVDAVDVLYQGGWSVLAYGPAEVVDGPDEIERLANLPLRPWWPGARDRWIRVRIDTITGRRLRDPD